MRRLSPRPIVKEALHLQDHGQEIRTRDGREACLINIEERIGGWRIHMGDWEEEEEEEEEEVVVVVVVVIDGAVREAEGIHTVG
jgi:hypothetical protein